MNMKKLRNRSDKEMKTSDEHKKGEKNKVLKISKQENIEKVESQLLEKVEPEKVEYENDNLDIF